MKHKLKGFSALLCIALVTVLLFIARRSGIPGFVFTGFDALTPLTGSISFMFAVLIAFLRTVLKIILYKSNMAAMLHHSNGTLAVMLNHLPGLCGAASWVHSRKFFTIFISILCAFLFLIHPIGQASAVYALYWIIPIVGSFYMHNSLFMRALVSTFITHAVGSVLCLYTAATTPVLWWSLLPVVIIERLLFASLMVVVYRVCQTLGSLLSLKSFKQSEVVH